jgi:integrase
VDPSAETLGEYLARWLEGKQASHAVRTHQIQADHLERHILPVIGKERLQKLSPAHLRRLFDSLNRAGLGASSQRQVHQFLISALCEALRLELVTRNVAEVVKPTPAREKEKTGLASFTAEEALKFAQAAQEDRWGAPFLFALSTGMRRDEVVGLRWQDVDLEAA